MALKLKPLLAFALLAFAVSLPAATNTVYFDLGIYTSSGVAYKQVRIAPSKTSFPRAEGNQVTGIDYGFLTTDATGKATNVMVSGTYDITFTNRFLATTFQITVPSTNASGILSAAELTTSGTNSPSNLAAYSITASDARYPSAFGSNVVSWTSNGVRWIASAAGGSGGSATNAVATIRTNSAAVASGATSITFTNGTNIQVAGVDIGSGEVKITINSTLNTNTIQNAASNAVMAVHGPQIAGNSNAINTAAGRLDTLDGYVQWDGSDSALSLSNTIGGSGLRLGAEAASIGVTLTLPAVQLPSGDVATRLAAAESTNAALRAATNSFLTTNKVSGSAVTQNGDGTVTINSTGGAASTNLDNANIRYDVRAATLQSTNGLITLAPIDSHSGPFGLTQSSTTNGWTAANSATDPWRYRNQRGNYMSYNSSVHSGYSAYDYTYVYGTEGPWFNAGRQPVLETWWRFNGTNLAGQTVFRSPLSWDIGLTNGSTEMNQFFDLLSWKGTNNVAWLTASLTDHSVLPNGSVTLYGQITVKTNFSNNGGLTMDGGNVSFRDPAHTKTATIEQQSSAFVLYDPIGTRSFPIQFDLFSKLQSMIPAQFDSTVGIGTSSPTNALDVKGHTSLRSNVFVGKLADIAGGNAKDLNGNYYVTNSTGIDGGAGGRGMQNPAVAHLNMNGYDITGGDHITANGDVNGATGNFTTLNVSAVNASNVVLSGTVSSSGALPSVWIHTPSTNTVAGTNYWVDVNNGNEPTLVGLTNNINILGVTNTSGISVHSRRMNIELVIDQRGSAVAPRLSFAAGITNGIGLASTNNAQLKSNVISTVSFKIIGSNIYDFIYAIGHAP